MPKKTLTDREKAALSLQRATGDAPAICAAALDRYSDVELACLAHAHDERSPQFAHEVIGFAATRQRFAEIAAARQPKDLSEDDTVILPE